MRQNVYLHMQKLNFPTFSFRFKNSEKTPAIFDPIRKKFVVLTPEEWVRQHVVAYLIDCKNYPKSLINVEKLLKVGGLAKRYDVVVFKNDGSIRLLVECKAPEVTISQPVFDQIARYNLAADADLLWVTNGLIHYFCKLDYELGCYDFLAGIPNYEPSTNSV